MQSKYNFSIKDFAKYKSTGNKITMITAYDYYSAIIAEKSGINTILVGDSLGMVIQGNTSTLQVTLDHIIYHTQAVRNGAPNTFIIADMPYLSYHIDVKDSIINAGKLMTQGLADAVKLEINNLDTIKHLNAIINAQIPVVAHIGLTPQSINIFGGFTKQGKNEVERKHILDIAHKLNETAIIAVVLECIPNDLAIEITAISNIPTIGIGSGCGCDGQVLVFHDLLGFNDHAPKFVKQYINSQELLINATKQYINDVKSFNSIPQGQLA